MSTTNNEQPKKQNLSTPKLTDQEKGRIMFHKAVTEGRVDLEKGTMTLLSGEVIQLKKKAPNNPQKEE